MTSQAHKPAALKFSLLVSRLHAELVRKLDRKLGALHGLSFVDFTVLSELSQDASGRMRRVDLAEKLGLTQSAVTRILAPLERIGMVKRHSDPNDARVGYAVLTKTGRSILEEATVTAAVVCDDMFAGVPDTDFDAVSRTFRLVTK